MEDIEFKGLITKIGKELEEEGKTLLTINKTVTFNELENILNNTQHEKREKAIRYLTEKQINQRAKYTKKILKSANSELKKEKPNQAIIQMGLDLLNNSVEELNLLTSNYKRTYKKIKLEDLDFIPNKDEIKLTIKEELGKGKHPIEIGHELGISAQLVMFLKDANFEN